MANQNDPRNKNGDDENQSRNEEILRRELNNREQLDEIHGKDRSAHRDPYAEDDAKPPTGDE